MLGLIVPGHPQPSDPPPAIPAARATLVAPASATDLSSLPIRPQIVYTIRVSPATPPKCPPPNAPAPAAQTPPELDPIRPGPVPRPAPPASDGRPPLPARPAPIRATPAHVRAAPPRLPANPAVQPPPPPRRKTARLFAPRAVGEGWSLPWTQSGGEGLPVEASPRSAVAPSRPHRPPNPGKKAPRAASRVFWKKLLLRARPPLPPTPATLSSDPPSPPQQPPLPVIPASSAGTQHHGQSQRTHATPTSPASRAHLPLFSHYSLLSPHPFLPAPQPSQSRPKKSAKSRDRRPGTPVRGSRPAVASTPKTRGLAALSGHSHPRLHLRHRHTNPRNRNPRPGPHHRHHRRQVPPRVSLDRHHAVGIRPVRLMTRPRSRNPGPAATAPRVERPSPPADAPSPPPRPPWNPGGKSTRSSTSPIHPRQRRPPSPPKYGESSSHRGFRSRNPSTVYNPSNSGVSSVLKNARFLALSPPAVPRINGSRFRRV